MILFQNHQSLLANISSYTVLSPLGIVSYVSLTCARAVLATTYRATKKIYYASIFIPYKPFTGMEASTLNQMVDSISCKALRYRWCL